MNLTAVEIKAFVPAREINVAAEFYRMLGFEIPWINDDLAYVRHGNTSFLLQQFYVPEHAGNFMMHMLVENVDDWHRQVLTSGVVEKFHSRVDAPEDRPWGIRDFPLVDPTGVLWRIGQNIEAPT
ncbi:MAG: VOC family protein [Pseudomonadota bacterium]